MPPTTENILRGYFHAKDENRPHLLSQVFAEDAHLEMRVKSDAITFPAATQGRDTITDVLVRKFGQTYENVYSFYLQRPLPDTFTDQYSCDWMVVMSDKESRNLRVGCGRYDWQFQAESPCLVTHLHITIEAMQKIAPDPEQTILSWAARLPYPWCDAAEITEMAPHLDELKPVLDYLTRQQ